MMRYALRRLVILPLALVLAVVVFVLLPVVGAVQAIVALGVVVGRRPRWRALRLRHELHMVWWNEPRPDLAGEQECSRWLNHCGQVSAAGKESGPPSPGSPGARRRISRAMSSVCGL